MKISIKESLPAEIEELIHMPSVQQINIGESKSAVFKVALKSGGSAYLKCSSSSYVSAEIETEIQVLQWIKKWIAVPSIIRHVKDHNTTFFLMTAIAGQNLADFSKNSIPAECLTLSARYLKRIHTIPIDACPFHRNLSITLKLAEQNLQLGFVGDSAFDKERIGFKAQ